MRTGGVRPSGPSSRSKTSPITASCDKGGITHRFVVVELEAQLQKVTRCSHACLMFAVAICEITRYHSNRGVSSVSRCAADLEIGELQ